MQTFRLRVPDRGSNPRVLHLPPIQGGPQITIYLRLGNPFGERDGQLFPFEHRAALQGADEVGEVGDETIVDLCSDDKTGRHGGLTPSRYATINRRTKRDARRHTGKPTEPLCCETPKRRRQRWEITGGSRLPPSSPRRRANEADPEARLDPYKAPAGGRSLPLPDTQGLCGLGQPLWNRRIIWLGACAWAAAGRIL